MGQLVPGMHLRDMSFVPFSCKRMLHSLQYSSSCCCPNRNSRMNWHPDRKAMALKQPHSCVISLGFPCTAIPYVYHLYGPKKSRDQYFTTRPVDHAHNPAESRKSRPISWSGGCRVSCFRFLCRTEGTLRHSHNKRNLHVIRL